MMRFVDEPFNESLIYNTTIGVDFRFRTIKIYEDCEVKLKIWDTAGMDKYQIKTPSAYYMHAYCVMIVFDVSNIKSFNNISKWLTEMKKYAPSTSSAVIIGNKCDIDKKEREIDYKTAKKYANSLGIEYIETSAKNAYNVRTAFLEMI